MLLSAVSYPLIVAGIQPLGLLLTAGWRTVFGIDPHLWNLGLTVLGGLLLYLVLSADIVRLGLAALLGGRAWFRIPLYAVCAGVATQLPRLLLEAIYGSRRGWPLSYVLERVASGFWSGGSRIALMYALALLALGYLAAVRCAAVGEAGAGRSSLFERCISGLIAAGAFTVVSLQSTPFVVDTLVVLLLLAVAYLAWFVGTSKCVACGHRPWSSLALRTTCRCGADRLPYLRLIVREPYSEHLKASARP